MRLFPTLELRVKHLSLFVAAACLAGSAHADALSDFVPIFNACKATFQGVRAGGVEADIPPNWIRKIATESRLKYDISQKYYSSPFIAVLTIDLTETFGTADNEAAARQLVAGPDNRLRHDVVRLSYTYQDGLWRTTDAELVTETKRRRDDPWSTPVTTRRSGDTLRRGSEPWVPCVR